MFRTWCLLLLVLPLLAFQKPSPFPEKEKRKPAPRETPKQAPKETPRKAPAEQPAPPASGDTGLASFCGPGLDGRRTANGEIFDNKALTAAHATLPLGSRVKVTNLGNGKSVVVRINDRFRSSRTVILVTRRAAEELDFVAAGSARVKIEPAE